MLGIGGGQQSQIACNLQSSACNPYVIEDLKNAQGVTVRSHPRLHAKIYATNKFAIIGSSNASSNGLAIEGPPESWIEANVISDDPATVRSAFALFQEIWDSPETSKITSAALTEAKKLWDNRPKQQNLSGIPQIAAHFRLLLSLTGVPGKRDSPQAPCGRASGRADAPLSYEKW